MNPALIAVILLAFTNNLSLNEFYDYIFLFKEMIKLTGNIIN